ncbi:hypothetical protein ACWC10_37875 [Streptomyces sp. NPDC001595]|uniref:hypothetical protein n=1 Tax=Streptomyces sp. NPDC001532 TaxID=3154520 RepID=UPI00332948CB
MRFRRFTVRRALAVAAAVALLIGAGAARAPQRAEVKGGSNYFTYRVDADCTREPYGVVNSYDQAPGLIREQLARMAAAGQKRLRIPVFHHHGPDSGTVMDSSEGGLGAANLRNLRDLLRDVRSAGFEAVEIAFFPMDANDPTDWTRFDRPLYEENLAVVRQVRAETVRSGLPYVIDLLNEGAPADGEDVLLRYDRTLWQDYRRQFGRADTVGFSMTVWIAGRVPNLPAVYGDEPPATLEVHPYGQEHDGDEYRQFMDADAALDAIGYRQPLIVGEVYYDDREAADNIRRAMLRAERPVRYLTQWPWPRTAKCPAADVAPPVAYGAYAAAGF